MQIQRKQDVYDHLYTAVSNLGYTPYKKGYHFFIKLLYEYRNMVLYFGILSSIDVNKAAMRIC